MPNELQQQAAGQRQDRESDDNEFQLRYQHIINASLLFNARGAYQDLSAALWSNSLSTPIAAARAAGSIKGMDQLALAGAEWTARLETWRRFPVWFRA